MWQYEKKLQYPVKIANPNPKYAQIIISQYGGPDGELGASLRYLSQRYSMPFDELKGLLTDIGTEEMAHQEVLSAVIRQLTDGLTATQIEKSDFYPFYLEHTGGIYPTDTNGVPYTVATFQSKGDLFADLHEDLAADAAIMQEQQDPETGMKNGRNTNVGTSFLTHCSQMKEPPSAQAERRLLCISQAKMVGKGWLAH